MAVSKIAKTTLNLHYVCGQDEKGKDIYKNQRFSKVKPAAVDDDIFEAAQALVSLMPMESMPEVQRENVNLLVEA